jgi:hypothetical protein
MFCVRPGKDQDHLRLKRAHFDDRAYWDDLSTDSICRNQADPERFPDCCSKWTKSHARLSEARDTRQAINGNVTNSFSRVPFRAYNSPLIHRCPALRSHAVMHTPSSSTQREALVNCTNVTIEPIHNNLKPPTPPINALFKRSRPADDGGARLKRLKNSIGESRTGEDELEDSADESEEDSDSSSTTYCGTARRKRTIFQAKNALAMSRPGVTCRPLPCEPSSLVRPSCR